jgi:GTP-binding protein
MKNISVGQLFLKPCQFLMGGVAMESLPAPDYPEIAFAGRSNVGKSSLVNALTRQKIAKASNTPGRTRELNFFLLAEQLMIVDLPGYGYAEAPKTEVARWTRLVKAYLKGRPNLMRVCVLIDSRHGIKEVDEGILEMLDTSAVSYQIVLTKIDKIKASELAEVVEKAQSIIKKHPAAFPTIFTTSSEKGDGLDELRNELAGFAQKNR